MIIPLTVGATRIVTKGLKKNFEAIRRKISIDSHGTSHIIWKIL
jgi:hypothetical protein